jgi:hypothetical protein
MIDLATIPQMERCTTMFSFFNLKFKLKRTLLENKESKALFHSVNALEF